MRLGEFRTVAIRLVNRLIAHIRADEAPSLSLEPFDILVIAAWFAILTGLAQVSVLAFRKFIQHAVIGTSVHTIWMTPLADLFFFLIPGLFFFLLAQRWQTLSSLPVIGFVFAFLGFLSLLLMFSELYILASLLLAAGLAFQTARYITAHPKGFYLILRHTIGWLDIPRKSGIPNTSDLDAGITGSNSVLTRRQFLISAGTMLGGLAVGVRGWEALSEFGRLNNLPPGTADSPNILLIVLDTVRAQNLSVYGYHRPTTPQLMRLAKRSVLFEQAFSTSPWTLPSHANMFTGHYPHELSSDWTIPLDGTFPTLAQVLGKQGYQTAGFVSNLTYCSYEFGLGRGFSHYEDYPVSIGETLLNSSLAVYVANRRGVRQLVGYNDALNRKSAAALTGDFLSWLSQRDQHRPFFAFLNYMDAHEPYLPPPPYDQMFGPKTPQGIYRYQKNDVSFTARWKSPPVEVQAQLDAYDGAIAYIDDQLGLMYDELQRMKLLENTLTIVTSDHGELFGEHRLFGHGNSLYLPTLRVPLLISLPSRLPVGAQVHEPISLSDLPATILALVGLENKVQFPGISLARYWEPQSVEVRINGGFLLSEVKRGYGPEWYPNRKGDMKSLLGEGYHYIWHEDGVEELYDVENDPFEEHDLGLTEDGRRKLGQFRGLLSKFP